MKSTGDTEEQLRRTLETLAAGVEAAPPEYRRARAQWRSRERRRRLILAILIALVFAVADGIGLWALNQAPESPSVIFEDPAGVSSPGPAGRLGPP